MSESYRETHCFPDADKFNKQYTDFLKNKISLHEIEYTLPTAREFLASKCVSNYNSVPIFADSNYANYICGQGNKSLCIVTRMNSDIRTDMIKSALDTMSTTKRS